MRRPLREKRPRRAPRAGHPLLADLNYARHFLSCCSRMLGLAHQSNRRHLGVEYYGRTVTVKILPVGVDMAQLRSVVAAPEALATLRDLSLAFKDRVVLLGVDDVDLFKASASSSLPWSGSSRSALSSVAAPCSSKSSTRRAATAATSRR
ncbi:Alpha,alpha-trehalose-phosphate synthase (UDP-forming) 5 [Ananas comosus]|uniref:Alpha,alpha-trehalose-phosphate synthase (UDP-forming) 5 n=1 Tax=Ananas comosus TaxID=4615 RepID=A0A199UL94_ANACO|nr:Alpha,alpha-trehalose-phosphate synthase (UDP-forming) 5 [Ananas comosus]